MELTIIDLDSAGAVSSSNVIMNIPYEKHFYGNLRDFVHRVFVQKQLVVEAKLAFRRA